MWLRTGINKVMLSPNRKLTFWRWQMTMKVVLVAALLGSLSASGAIHTETLEYRQGDTVLKGFLAYDSASKAKRPGVLVVHEWWGLNDYARRRAEMLAREGYVALAVDMFGEGKSTKHPETAGQWAGEVSKNAELRKARFLAGRDALAKNPLVLPGEIAAIGYCFGGGTVLAMAEAGLDLKGVVSFHGSLPQDPAPKGGVKAKVLVCHGAADSFTSPEQVQTFQKNLADAGADWQFISYSGAKHGFTNPDADKLGMEGLAYNAAADHRSWSLALSFLKEAFGR